ncbi:formylmethanofuran dehydrogenase [Clostridium botulinum]|uniref:FmdE family protein n=1 Tax=Clostridium botulinum TaxID=1491 RepID=UPI000A176CC2|nr:FmdE family protein [Clostridium botulinum]AUN11174.1 formylmethanofuran dehydrogenase [Clostridium botulinum]AUN21632.1 formylmethanofuran dehydrogenase [Clostridium botulinum]AUN25486.1 formylmethanofuran dehydrogenase [Clostridium botulinum]OSA70579.1 formylmethanofuran dehydrogenase [Clostridium botulinum]QDY21108.1 formylmethanofuran dehydrogenase [Clostridium botulinum]
MKEGLWERCTNFHGHSCPGLAIGYKAVEAAIETMNIKFSEDEEIVCVTENDACGVDAIQVLLGCSLGKGNIIHKDSGKMAFSFFNRKNEESIRMIFSPKEKMEDRNEYMNYILNADYKELFQFKKPNYSLPERARLFKNITCEICNESTGEHRVRIMDGKMVCSDCFKEYSRVL